MIKSVHKLLIDRLQIQTAFYIRNNCKEDIIDKINCNICNLQLTGKYHIYNQILEFLEKTSDTAREI